MKHEMKDSGLRVKTPTGSMKERAPGKGRYDLISPVMMRRLAIVLEKGALKYAPRNWEKGIPLSWYLDAALRHTFQYLDGQRDEDHLAQAIFNLMAIIHTEEELKTGRLPQNLGDLPKSP